MTLPEHLAKPNCTAGGAQERNSMEPSTVFEWDDVENDAALRIAEDGDRLSISVRDGDASMTLGLSLPLAALLGAWLRDYIKHRTEHAGA